MIYTVSYSDMPDMHLKHAQCTLTNHVGHNKRNCRYCLQNMVLHVGGKWGHVSLHLICYIQISPSHKIAIIISFSIYVNVHITFKITFRKTNKTYNRLYFHFHSIGQLSIVFKYCFAISGIYVRWEKYVYSILN